ncbi:MAG: HDOD domain-containing protein [Syntrophorhabdales bacterium]
MNLTDGKTGHVQTLSPREDLLEKAEALKVLPTLNAIIDEVFRVLADDNSSFSRLFGIVKYDQAISSKVISIANSAYFGRGTRIVNLEKAMAAIGFDEIKRIVMCVVVFLKEMLHQWKLSQADLTAHWIHTLSVACAAKILAGKTLTEDREKVFTVSILHDIGKVPLLMYGDRYRELAEEARDKGRDIASLEREAFGIDHQEIGHFMSVKWRFPEEFSEVIKTHHGRLENPTALVDLVMKADRFIDNSPADLGPEAFILREEAGRIEAETKRIGELLGVA